MTTFEVKEEFLLNGEPFKIISGAIHYFRIHPQYWEHSLYNLKAMGCNTVETYIPWNIHEPQKGVFDFEAGKDIVKFIEIAEHLGLYVIVRPAPFICAEWEFGGLPAWLLVQEEMVFRSSDPAFVAQVTPFYDHILEKLVPLQVTHGGPILMMQVENEYGSYGNDKAYLKTLTQIMKNSGVDVPLFTSDGSWEETLEAGTLPEEGLLITGNFGSKAKENFAAMQAFFDQKKIKQPLMCMEFWDGWFNRYNEPIIRRDPQEFAETLKEMVSLGSLNFYMFQGGTNFGFMNGCSSRGQRRLPQVTSYDYDALLTEWGDPTPKYYLAQEILSEYATVSEPKVLAKGKAIGRKTMETRLFDQLENISERHTSLYPKTMEHFGQSYGYILYRTMIKTPKKSQTFLLAQTFDRAHVYVDGKLEKILYQETLLEEFTIDLSAGDHQLDVLVENMGRVNYGPLLQSEGQKKGIGRGLRMDLHFESDWEIYPLTMDDIAPIKFEKEVALSGPIVAKYEMDCEKVGDLFLDTRSLGKGVAYINGFNLGRYWEVGPIGYLYIPAPLLKTANNELVIVETDQDVLPETLTFLDAPCYIETENKDNFKKETAPI